jgi:hypothetical protein
VPVSVLGFVLEGVPQVIKLCPIPSIVLPMRMSRVRRHAILNLSRLFIVIICIIFILKEIVRSNSLKSIHHFKLNAP